MNCSWDELVQDVGVDDFSERRPVLQVHYGRRRFFFAQSCTSSARLYCWNELHVICTPLLLEWAGRHLHASTTGMSCTSSARLYCWNELHVICTPLLLEWAARHLHASTAGMSSTSSARLYCWNLSCTSSSRLYCWNEHTQVLVLTTSRWTSILQGQWRRPAQGDEFRRPVDPDSVSAHWP